MDVDNVAEAYGYAAGAPTWAHPLDPSGVGSLPFPSFHHSELTEDTFNHLWARGEPLVVRGVLENSTIPWTPDYFKSEYGGVSCTIVDCEDDNAIGVSTTVGEFFDRFREHEDGEKVLKLKDWPPTASFSETAPVLYEDFHAMIPMGNYTRRDGVLNIASHFPTDAIAPDLGPKMYNAFASRETPGGKGSTRLHKDIADAVNIMVYAAPNDGKEGCAVWDIFPQADSEKICSFLKEHFKPTDNMDPIHSQSYYLDSALRKKLFDKYGVKSWRMYQRAGEAVFIPAGCAHQVRAIFLLAICNF
ncbi:Clavaminate synthase-like protein [Calocera cornea HHB12733]|uniref:Clavaminate synthase-like protein n=1 Tax=Calocera cornea HHB12733 TaxID=1353952 RepID=A0A165JQN7_9BASI|nr:Clavaminate synthase-like protein [Calocera cornea HHB12733]